jgi:hypothetical protein
MLTKKYDNTSDLNLFFLGHNTKKNELLTKDECFFLGEISPNFNLKKMILI